MRGPRKKWPNHPDFPKLPALLRVDYCQKRLYSVCWKLEPHILFSMTGLSRDRGDAETEDQAKPGKQRGMIVGGKLKTKRFDRMFDWESQIRAQVREGDVEGALASLRNALRKNPQDACFRFLQGVLRHSVGMAHEALSDLEGALFWAKDKDLRARITDAIVSIENEQLELMRLLLSEDKRFRMEFAIDPVAAAEKRGFRFRPVTQKALFQILGDFSGLQGCDQPGSC